MAASETADGDDCVLRAFHDGRQLGARLNHLQPSSAAASIATTGKVLRVSDFARIQQVESVLQVRVSCSPSPGPRHDKTHQLLRSRLPDRNETNKQKAII